MQSRSRPDRLPPETYRQKERTFYTAEEFARATGGKVRMQHGVDPAQEAALRRAYVPLPVTEFTVIAASEARHGLGTRPAPFASDPVTAAASTFAGQRWLPDDHVTGIGLTATATWIETPRGYSRIAYVPMSLSEKSRVFVDRVQARHNRWGLTADSRLRVPGDLSTQSDGLERQRRSVDGDVRRGRMLPLQGDR